MTGTTLSEHSGTTNAVSGTEKTGTSTSPNISIPSDIIAPSLSTASMPLPTTDDQPDLVIIIEGDSDPIIKTEALQPVEEISISPATLEQINLEVTKDKSSGCGTVEVANESCSSAQEPNWSTSPRTEDNLVWGSPKDDSGSYGEGRGGWGSCSPKGFDSKGAEGSPFDKPSMVRPT